MSIFSFSMVKNESDIIESFVRYNSSFFDGMVVLDNGSTDGTYEILQKLIDEGLSLFLLKDPLPSYDQSKIMTNLLYAVTKVFDTKFVIPLDADEFIFAENEDHPGEILKGLDTDKLHYVPWVTYVPTEQDGQDDFFVPERLTHIRKKEPITYFKVIIPNRFVKKYRITVEQGNHDVVLRKFLLKIPKGNLVNFDANLKLAHFPIRTKSQIMSKFLIGWLAYLTKSDYEEELGRHWRISYEKIKQNGEMTQKDLTDYAMEFAADTNKIENEIVSSPLNIQHIKEKEILYKDLASSSYLQNLLNYSEYLARELSTARKTGVNKVNYRNYYSQLNNYLSH